MSQFPPPPPPGGQYPPQDYSDQSTPGVAIAALICGILGLCVFPFALVALVCGIIGLAKTGSPNAAKGRGFALAGTILGGVAIVVAPLLIAILLPALGAARRTARRMQNTTHLRAIHQGMFSYSNSNKSQFPGLDGGGQFVPNGAQTGSSGDGSTPQARMWVLLDGRFITTDYAISPSESDPGVMPYSHGSGPVTSDHYSYAMLQLDAGASGRMAEWRQTLNSQAIVFSDRNTGSNTGTAIQSLHTSGPGEWRGSMVWNDGHAGFEQSPIVQTKYGSGAMNTQDHLFEDEQPRGSNALMQHK